jgi:nucleoside 2-deoxyribosyltransferase
MKKKDIIYCAGPSFSPEDRWHLSSLDSVLTGHGFSTYIPSWDGIDNLIISCADRDRHDRMKLSRSAFALNAFHLVTTSRCVIFIMNGRVPDEGGTVASAIAAMAGIPVILLKEDHRSVFHGNDNSMITGLTDLARKVKKTGAVIDLLERRLTGHAYVHGRRPLPHRLERAVRLGGDLRYLLDEKGYHGGGKAGAELMGKILSLYDSSDYASEVVRL